MGYILQNLVDLVCGESGGGIQWVFLHHIYNPAMVPISAVAVRKEFDPSGKARLTTL
jgi:hypothetical protein